MLTRFRAWLMGLQDNAERPSGTNSTLPPPPAGMAERPFGAMQRRVSARAPERSTREIVVRDLMVGNDLPAEMPETTFDSPTADFEEKVTSVWEAPRATAAPREEIEDDMVCCERLDEHQLRMLWRVSDLGMRRATCVLAGDGVLAVRLVTVPAADGGSWAPVVHERVPVTSEGEWTLQLGDAEAGLKAAFAVIGLRLEDRFAAIAHVRL